MNGLLVFIEMKQKNTTNSQYFFMTFHRLVLGLVELIDAKRIGVAQLLWS
jgi:hypothetical protein